MPKAFYVAPLTGNENHVSANELLRHRMTQYDMTRHKSRIKNMKPSVDNGPPKSSQLKHLMTNRKKKELEFQRYSEIERENYRLLDKMSKIMVRNAADSVFGVHSSINCPALDGEKARNRKTKTLLEQNQVMLRRILQTKPYYSSVEWDKHTEKTDSLMGHMCRYPVRLVKGANRPDSSMGHEASIMSEATQMSGRSVAGHARRHGGHSHGHAAQKRGGATSAPPGAFNSATADAVGGVNDEAYAEDFESEDQHRDKATSGGGNATAEVIAEDQDQADGRGDYANESFETDAQ